MPKPARAPCTFGRSVRRGREGFPEPMAPRTRSGLRTADSSGSSPAGDLKKVAVAGGPPVTLAEHPNGRSAWSAQGVILYTRSDDFKWPVPNPGQWRPADTGDRIGPVPRRVSARPSDVPARWSQVPVPRAAATTARRVRSIWLRSIPRRARVYSTSTRSRTTQLGSCCINAAVR